MEFLDGKRAHGALVRAFGESHIVPDTGARIASDTIDFELIRRGFDYDDRMIYRLRVDENDVLRGQFIGAATLQTAEVGGQRSEVRSQRSEVGGRRSDGSRGSVLLTSDLCPPTSEKGGAA